jgi:hypothetical protein
MSVFKSPRSPFYQYDFEYRGQQFRGSTRTANLREAKKVQAEARKKVELGLQPEIQEAAALESLQAKIVRLEARLTALEERLTPHCPLNVSGLYVGKSPTALD